MKLLRLFAILSLTFFSSQILAVDGFQELKFGMTLDDVKKSKKM